MKAHPTRLSSDESAEKLPATFSPGLIYPEVPLDLFPFNYFLSSTLLQPILSYPLQNDRQAHRRRCRRAQLQRLVLGHRARQSLRCNRISPGYVFLHYCSSLLECTLIFHRTPRGSEDHPQVCRQRCDRRVRTNPSTRHLGQVPRQVETLGCSRHGNRRAGRKSFRPGGGRPPRAHFPHALPRSVLQPDGL